MSNREELLTIQTQISKSITEILSDVECLIIPGLGAFLKKESPAQLLDKEQLIIPPSVTLSFNPSLSDDDGLLTHHLKESLQISYAEASEQIKRWVLFLKRNCEIEGRLEIEGLGIFTFISNKEMDRKSIVQFESDSSLLFDSKHLGLKKIKAKKIVRQGFAKRVQDDIQEKKDSPVYVHNFKRAAMQIAAAVLVFGLIGTAIWRMDDISTGAEQLKLKAISIFESSNDEQNTVIEEKEQMSVESEGSDQTQKSTAQDFDMVSIDDVSTVENDNSESELDAASSLENDNLVEQDETGPVGIDETDVAEEKIEEEKIEEAKIDNTDVVTSSEVKDESSGNYVVIAGCFSSYRNAVNYKLQLKKLGYDADILYHENSGLNRVIYGSYNSRPEAIQALRAIQYDHNVQAWMTTK